jgi:hypothetical protein
MTWLRCTYSSPWTPFIAFVVKWVVISQILGVTAYVILRRS